MRLVDPHRGLDQATDARIAGSVLELDREAVAGRAARAMHGWKWTRADLGPGHSWRRRSCLLDLIHGLRRNGLLRCERRTFLYTQGRGPRSRRLRPAERKPPLPARPMIHQ